MFKAVGDAGCGRQRRLAMASSKEGRRGREGRGYVEMGGIC